MDEYEIIHVKGDKSMDAEFNRRKMPEYGGIALIGLWFICYGTIKILNQYFDFIPEGIIMRVVQILTYTPLALGILVIHRQKTAVYRDDMLKVQYAACHNNTFSGNTI